MSSLLRVAGILAVTSFVCMGPAAGVDKPLVTLKSAGLSMPKLKAVHHFATLVNDSEELARNCRIEIEQKHGLSLSFWTTNQTSNQHAGRHNQSADVWPGSAQSFSFVLRAIAKPAVIAGAVFATFVCDVHQSPVAIEGVNDIRLESFDFSGLPRLEDGNPGSASETTARKSTAGAMKRLWH